MDHLNTVQESTGPTNGAAFSRCTQQRRQYHGYVQREAILLLARELRVMLAFLFSTIALSLALSFTVGCDYGKFITSNFGDVAGPNIQKSMKEPARTALTFEISKAPRTLPDRRTDLT